MRSLLRLGAFDVALDECSADHRQLLEGLFRVRAEPLTADAPLDLAMTLLPDVRGGGFSASDALECREEDGCVHFTSDVVAGELESGSPPSRLRLRIATDHPRARHLDHYLRIVLNAAFRKLDRIRLHAAAVDFGGAVSLFAGDKGSGKTTICLHLARAGGSVLGEDQIMVRRTASGPYLAAGGDDLMRVTAKTEAHFFAEPIAAPALDFAGTAKKEIRAASFITYLPNGEWPLRRIFFPEVRDRFAIRSLARRETLQRLAAPLLLINRFTSDTDRRDFIDFLAGLARQVEGFSLTLTPDLTDLYRLSCFLQPEAVAEER